MESKLTKLRGGVTLVKPEERRAIEDLYVQAISHWRKRKRMFRDIWDAITENLPKDLKEFKVLPLILLFITLSANRVNFCFKPSHNFILFSGGTWPGV